MSRPLLPLLAAVAALAAAGPAHATTVQTDPESTLPVLTAGAGERNDIAVSADGSGLAFTDSAGISLGDPPDLGFCHADGPTRVECPTAKAAHIDAGDGDDRVVNATDRPMLIRGGPGTDTLVSGSGADSIFGDRGSENRSGAGNDTITAGGGDDHVAGEGGNDHLDSGDGADIVSGQEGDDKVSSGPGNDEVENFAQSLSSGDNIEGDTGNDVVDAGAGNDLVYSTLGRDHVKAGAGNDAVVVEAVNWLPTRKPARADCGPGDDTFSAGVGDVVAGCERFETQAFCNTTQRSCRYQIFLGALVSRRPVIFARRFGSIKSPKAIYVKLGARAMALARRRGGVAVRAQMQIAGTHGFVTPLYLFTLKTSV